ncbi:hypothetical protein LCGC14_1387340 [marine sediment metagenome]|uniref:Uncharacterized protein n=1 Tax=marine sediment metagenome TaxID=412755 RepID=A0A0F9MGI0_9ZZZZ
MPLKNIFGDNFYKYMTKRLNSKICVMAELSAIQPVILVEEGWVYDIVLEYERRYKKRSEDENAT